MKAKKLHASNKLALRWLILPTALLLAGVPLALSQSMFISMLGILLLSLFLTQSFILLHECGHLNFFQGYRTNKILGNVFGLLSCIPFYNWVIMHNLHHKWTGWRDKDPTTEDTVHPSPGIFTRSIANTCWWLFIPVFYFMYLIKNYWHLPKIKRYNKPHQYRWAIMYTLVYLLIYTTVVYVFPTEFLTVYLPSLLLSFVWKELIILTQHTHVDIPLSEGKKVHPIPFAQQQAYTRSFYLHPWLEHYLLFNFNHHEIHHLQPGLPAYYLDQVEPHLGRNAPYFTWFRKAKKMKGSDFVFKTTQDTGVPF